MPFSTWDYIAAGIAAVFILPAIFSLIPFLIYHLEELPDSAPFANAQRLVIKLILGLIVALALVFLIALSAVVYTLT